MPIGLLLIVIGALLIFISIYKDWKLLRLYRTQSFYKLWKLRFSLLVFFFLFYSVIVLNYYSEALDRSTLLNIFGILLLMGGGFIFIESYVNTKTYESTEASNIALAKANVNMAMLYAQLEKMKSDLENQKNELAKAYRELKETQSHLIQMEKMAALGKLIASITHEINTPMGAINALSENIFDLLKTEIKSLAENLHQMAPEGIEWLNLLVMTALRDEGISTTKEDRKRRKEIEAFLRSQGIVEGDVLADRLVDMHITADIEKFLPLFQHKDYQQILHAAYILISIYENSRTIQISTQKVKKIIFSLKSFAHFEKDETPKSFDLKKNIDTVLILYHNQIKYGVELSTNFEQVSDITLIGYADELNQVWTNLIQNALQAMDYKGKLSIEIQEKEDVITISITDSGEGIPSNIADKIFEPFFTTKGSGEGSGLGLHIVKQILDKHRGEISFTSIPGHTTFIVKLPKNMIMQPVNTSFTCSNKLKTQVHK